MVKLQEECDGQLLRVLKHRNVFKFETFGGETTQI